ncbi:MAG: hypothetical protein ACOCV8_04460 [Spirochaetota bacterium]
MGNYKKHLYCLIYPNSALVASELLPEAFGIHYVVSYPKHYKGKIIFAEIDLNFRNPYFKIDEILEACYKPDGSPKRTKFVSSYRILEHIDIDAFKDIYLVTARGKILRLRKKEDEYDIQHEKEKLRIYQFMAPLYYLIATNFSPPEMGKYVSTDPVKGVPKSAMIQLEVDTDPILNKDDNHLVFSSPLPGVHPGYLKEALLELIQTDKKTKTLSLNSIFDEVPFTRIKHGIWINSSEKQIFYPMPSWQQLEKEHFHWFRDASY